MVLLTSLEEESQFDKVHANVGRDPKIHAKGEDKLPTEQVHIPETSAKTQTIYEE